MAARTPISNPVPDADHLLDGRGRLWTHLTPDPDRYTSYWETQPDSAGRTVGAYWGALDTGIYGRVTVLPRIEVTA